MFDDLPTPKADKDFPRILDQLSIDELKKYIQDLEEEITRVKSEITRKEQSRDAAASVFKS